MLLILSTLTHQEHENWFYKALLSTSAEKFGDTVFLSPIPGRSIDRSKETHRIPITWDIASMNTLLSGFGKSGQSTLPADRVGIWAERVSLLRGQNERVYLAPQKTVQQYAAICDGLITTLKPHALLVSNPATVLAGVLMESAIHHGIPVLTFERGILQGYFQFDWNGCGPHAHRPRAELASLTEAADEQDYRQARLAYERIALRTGTRRNDATCIFGEVASDFQDRAVGILGVDDTNLGVLPVGIAEAQQVLRFSISSFDLACEIATLGMFPVVFKPHPSAVHLALGRTRPGNLSILVGGLESFTHSVAAFCGLGSTADLECLRTQKPFILLGNSFLSGSGLVAEANSASEVFPNLWNQDQPVDYGKIIHYATAFLDETGCSRHDTSGVDRWLTKLSQLTAEKTRKSDEALAQTIESNLSSKARSSLLKRVQGIFKGSPL